VDWFSRASSQPQTIGATLAKLDKHAHVRAACSTLIPVFRQQHGCLDCCHAFFCVLIHYFFDFLSCLWFCSTELSETLTGTNIWQLIIIIIIINNFLLLLSLATPVIRQQCFY